MTGIQCSPIECDEHATCDEGLGGSCVCNEPDYIGDGFTCNPGMTTPCSWKITKKIPSVTPNTPKWYKILLTIQKAFLVVVIILDHEWKRHSLTLIKSHRHWWRKKNFRKAQLSRTNLRVEWDLLIKTFMIKITLLIYSTTHDIHWLLSD